MFLAIFELYRLGAFVQPQHEVIFLKIYTLDSDSYHVAEQRGDVRQTLADQATTTLDAVYQTPLLAHACMEPMNCTALYQNGSVELWMGSQSPTIARWGAQKGAHISGTVTVNAMRAGGGFGRRVEGDLARQATALAATVPGQPVKLIWSREEDIQHDTYRPHALSRFQARLDKEGLPLVWRHRIVTQSIDAGFGARNLPFGGEDGGADSLSVEGASDLVYSIPNFQVELVNYDSPVPVGFWRSVGHSNNAFFTESFLDECAYVAGLDPLIYRCQLLVDQPRYLAVLDQLAEKANWEALLDSGRGRGIALHPSFRSIVGQVAEVTVSEDKQVTVERIVCVIDCGFAINPDIIKAQMEGSIIYGLSALFGEITLAQGRVQQSNFHDYPLPRLSQAPAIEVFIIASDEKPGGVGEPGVPPVLPAVCNAIFAATGQRIRELPLAKAGFYIN